MSVGVASAILIRFIRPEVRDFTPEMAKHIVSFRLSEEERSYLANLLQKSNDGNLPGEQRSEYSSLAKLGELLTLMKLKAHAFLERPIKDGRAGH